VIARLDEAQIANAAVNNFEPRMDAAPALGEHSEAILRELGRGEADIKQLRITGVI
jgi:itaconate CoA-transferase